VIILAGFCAGAINAVVGWGTVITFPILLAMGYPPRLSPNALRGTIVIVGLIGLYRLLTV
jgi:uncharacterized protein